MMGFVKLWGALALVLLTNASPHSNPDAFLRSAVETVPEHDPIAAPIRSSVESIPLRTYTDEGDGRLPLRDAVERRLITLPDADTLHQVEDEQDVEVLVNGKYYGAASHMNNGGKVDDRLHLGNANLQAMQQTVDDPAARHLVVCYMESWAAYRAPPLAFTAGLVPKTCTHLHYAFATLHPHTYALIPTNEDYDVIKGGYRIATGLKRRIPGLKVIISVGGEGTDRLFSEMVQEPRRRNSFIDSALNFLNEHDFDGLDLHWTYPGEKDEKEKDLLTSLLYELREKFSSNGYLLSTVLPPLRYQIEDGYELSAVSGATDYTILQAWDMTQDKKEDPPSRAVQHSALHKDPAATHRDQRYDNIEFIVKYIIRKGMAADKLVLGIPVFGRSYTLASAQSTPGAPVTSWGDEGQYTQTKGLLSYFEICMAEREGSGITEVDEAGNSYIVFDKQWVAYDTPNTVLEKMKYVISSGLAGAAAWAIDMDDFRGLCGSPFPILSAIASSLNGDSIQSDQSSLKIGACESESPFLASDEDSCAHFHFCTGGINYRMLCEDERLYDPSTGFCGHQDVSKCLPGQSLRISVDDAARYLSSAYEVFSELYAEDIKDKLIETDADKSIGAALPYTKKGKDNNKRVVCYMTSWAFYRRGDGKFVPEHIDTRLCTHVVYAYASLSPDDLVAKEFDPWADTTNNLYERVTSLKDVKVLLGLGGWTDSAGDKYSRLVSSSASRAKFIEKVVRFLRGHHFKGLHVDWNYPVCWQSNCKKGAHSDKANFAKFIQELSKALHSADMELGVALSGYKEVIESAYDLPILSQAADFLSTMTYDYHGGWERKTAHHTPLVSSPNEALPYYSIEYAIESLISKGADPKKMLLGLSFYGQSFRLASAETGAPGSAAAGPGEPGEFTKQPGMLAYYEICYRVKNLRWKTGRQNKAGPYAYSDNQWVGYDDPKSITEKVEWAMRLGLGGVTAWAIDLDDYNNRCCGEPSPLLRAAGRAVGRDVPPAPPGCERPPPPVTPPPPTTPAPESDGSSSSTTEHSHGHDSHTPTAWPSWTPAPSPSTTAQTWWPQTSSTTTTTAPSTTITTTTTPRTTTTQRTTTTAKPTTSSTMAPVPPPLESGNIEDAPCDLGAYRAAPNDCESYLQCAAGRWRKHRCAPGLHWAAAVQRCDWPAFAKCTATSISEASTATSTLAPMTSRPPPRPTTTPKPTTTTSKPTTTTPKPTTTTRRTTTSTTTERTTTSRVTTAAPVESDGASEGKSCRGQDYHAVRGDCNYYLHCDGDMWRRQRCAPGLHWSQKQKHCDWPKYAKCEDEPISTMKTTTMSPRPSRPPRPTRPVTTTTPASTSSPSIQEDSPCSSKDLHAPATTCDSYLICVRGRWRKQLCPPGLHWDKRTNRCDWVEFAMCDNKNPDATKGTMSPIFDAVTTTRKPLTTTTKKGTSTSRNPQPTTTRKPQTTTTSKAIIQVDHKPATVCKTGTYHPHPRCESFFVCVNGMLIAQRCAPGLVWRPDNSQCDFPTPNSCKDRRGAVSASMIATNKPNTLMDEAEEPEMTFCTNGEYSSIPTDCSRYRQCNFGKFEYFSCSPGLHWNQERQICDWPKNAKCKKKGTTPSRPMSKPVVTAGPPEPKPEKPFVMKPSHVANSELTPKPSILKSGYKMVCYYTNWSWYRPGIGQYSPEDIDPTLCTHIVYSFAVLGDDGVITPHDSWADLDHGFYERVVEYKRFGTKVSIALGGWNDSAGDKYSKLVNDPSARTRFVEHAVEFLEKHGFDGLDLDWEYPKCWQVDCSKGPDSDKQGFADLVRELSAVLKPKGLLLSSAVSASKKVIDAGYDVPVLVKHLDWISVMAYDYHGQWDKRTGHVAPLYYHPEDDNTYFNSNYSIHYWMEKGAPASKLVMGMPLYGQSFTIGSQWDTPKKYLERKSTTGLNVPAISGGEAGEYTKAKGFLSYYEICERVQHRGWKIVQDPLKRMGPYAYKDNQWVSFDDIDMITKKVSFLKSLNLAGGMVWSLDLDDFKNRCGQGKYPLMNAIKKQLLNPNIDLESLKPSESMTAMSSQNSIDEDFEDIQVRPSKPTSKPVTVAPIQKPQISHTTNKPTTTAVAIPEERYKVVCYYSNWAWYRPGIGKYTPNDIDTRLCTHIVYAFAILDKNTLMIKPHDTWLDVENKFYEKVVALKSKGVKVVLGLGGWNDSADDKYSRLVNSPSSRRKFIVHAIDFIEQYGFDGLDLDWEYPKCWQVECEKGPDSDKQAFASLVMELREAFEPRGLLLSAAVSASKRVIDAGYDVRTLSKNLDWISLMTYDYHGQWEKKTGHVAPMYASEEDSDQTFNTNFTVNYWIQKGADRRKLVMGVPIYGQSFSLRENEAHGVGAAAYAGGDAGDETRARGFLAFYEICDKIRLKGWQVERDPGGRMGPYAYKDDQWVSFDDDFMVRHKAEYVRAMGLGGGMVWALDLDDFTGQNCGCGRSPLLATMNHILRDKEAPQPCQLEELLPPSTSIDISKPVTTEESEDMEDIPIPSEKPSHSHSPSEQTGSMLEGKPCSGVVFKADDQDCSKYYLCINGEYSQLTCPAPLVWNENHCDWPEKSKCQRRAQLRLPGEGDDEVKEKPALVCYFTNWAYYRQGKGKYGPEQVDVSQCSHVVYAWAHLDKNYKVVPGNPELDIENDFFGKITQLKMKGVKVILGVGGLEDSEEDKWNKMVASSDYRKRFVRSAERFVRKWKFDGLQLAWQYPVCKQAPCQIRRTNVEEKENFSALLFELSKALRRRDLELSVVVAASPKIASVAYDPEALSTTADWIIIAANDYYGIRGDNTAYLMPLETSDTLEVDSFNATLAYWASVVPIKQLVLTVPAYARSYTLRNADSSYLNAPSIGPGDEGTFTKIPGFLSYYEVCTGLRSRSWKETSNEDGTFAVSGSQWSSYLRPDEVHRIGSAVSHAGLRGAAIWALDLDDFMGVCACAPHPLLTALRQGLYDPDIPPTLCTLN